jgi:hypothetical protein
MKAVEIADGESRFPREVGNRLERSIDLHDACVNRSGGADRPLLTS